VQGPQLRDRVTLLRTCVTRAHLNDTRDLSTDAMAALQSSKLWPRLARQSYPQRLTSVARHTQAARAFSNTASTSTPESSNSFGSFFGAQSDNRSSYLESRAGIFDSGAGNSSIFNSSSLLSPDFDSNLAAAQDDLRHRLHIYSTKHNTHITLVQPARPASETLSSSISSTSAKASEQKKVVDVLLSLSTGNIGFKKAQRGTYDAGYQLTAFVLKQIQERGLLRSIKRVDVVLRGFGPGREAAAKVLLGSEGKLIRSKISAIMDTSRLKQGGTRSPRIRRLG